jgi:hypothetical protein
MVLTLAAAPQATAGDVPDAVLAYAPVVVLHPDETYWPFPAAEFVRRSALVFAHDAGCPDRLVAQAGAVDPARLGAGSYRARAANDRCDEIPPFLRSSAHTRPFDARRPGLAGGDGFALDLRGGSSGVPPAPADPAVYAGVPAYYSYVPERYVTYWFSYAFSVPGFVPVSLAGHEGDWEHVSVRLTSGDVPTQLAFFFHDEPPHIVPWTSVRKESTHPIVHSALGSHGSYAAAGLQARSCVRTRLGSFCGRDRTGSGRAWRTWESLNDVCAEPWYGYGGAWGAVSALGTYTTGGLPPSPYREDAPASFARGSRSCSDDA